LGFCRSSWLDDICSRRGPALPLHQISSEILGVCNSKSLGVRDKLTDGWFSRHLGAMFQSQPWRISMCTHLSQPQDGEFYVTYCIYNSIMRSSLSVYAILFCRLVRHLWSSNINEIIVPTSTISWFHDLTTLKTTSYDIQARLLFSISYYFRRSNSKSTSTHSKTYRAVALCHCSSVSKWQTIPLLP
jgi:hypothetical protein